MFLQQVLVGEHDLKIAKAGYQMLSDRINIQEKEIYTIDNKTLVQELADANSDSKNDDLAKSQPYNIIEKNVGHQTEQVTTRPSNTIPNRNASEKIFDVVEQMPSFSGGFVAMNEFFERNMQYPTTAIAIGIQGRVMITFVVEKDGTISDAKVVRSVASSLDQEALRMVKSMPKWTPGKQNGNPVRVRYTIPVVFRL